MMGSLASTAVSCLIISVKFSAILNIRDPEVSGMVLVSIFWDALVQADGRSEFRGARPIMASAVGASVAFYY